MTPSSGMTTLKFSTKAQTLIANVAPSIALKIDAERNAERMDKAGAVKIAADDADITQLRGHISARLPALDASLKAATTDEDRKPFFGEHSALSALLRQLPPPAATA